MLFTWGWFLSFNLRFIKVQFHSRFRQFLAIDLIFCKEHLDQLALGLEAGGQQAGQADGFLIPFPGNFFCMFKEFPAARAAVAAEAAGFFLFLADQEPQTPPELFGVHLVRFP